MRLRKVNGMDKYDSKSVSSEDGFEYIFDEKTRGSVLSLKKLLLVYGIIVVVALLIGILSEYRINGEITSFVGGISEEELFGIVFVLVMPLFVYAEMRPERKSRSWLFGKCRVDKNGIYLKHLRKEAEFVPWEDFVAVERQQMNLDRSKSVYVICCYRSLTAKTILEHTPTGGTKHLMYRVFYQHRNEIVTLGYDKKRMAKIRAFRGTGMSKSEKVQQLRGRELSAYESNRDL